MKTATKPLLTLTAADLMTEAVVLIPQNMSLQAAAHLLALHQVSGAPVVNEDGVCIGVLSATDFMHRIEKRPKGPANGHYLNCEYSSPWQMVEPEGLPEETVDRFMTANPVIVSPTVRITELAQGMVDARIHRVIIVDEFGHPTGIVSATDILAAVAAADPSRRELSEKGAEP